MSDNDALVRAAFPVLGSQGAKVDWQFVADHGKQAQRNHYQTVERLAQRGGLSWCELAAVIENREYKNMDTNDAIVAVRSAEAEYLAALRSTPQPEADSKLLMHFTRMQEAAANYVEPTTYVARHPVDKGVGLCKWNTEFPMPEPTHAPEAVASITTRRDQAFINDMIYMLDGPEQREAQAKPLDLPAQDEVEVVARAIHEHLSRRDIMQYLDNDEDCRGLATAAIAALDRHRAGDDALREENERLREALTEVRDKWISNNSEGDDYEEGYDDGLKACHDIARAALTGRQG